MSEINILITSCGRRVELVKEFRRAKEELHIDGSIVCSDMSPNAPALYFADKRELVPAIRSDKYIDRLIEIIKANNIALVVPTIDTELEKLSSSRERIEKETGAKVLISSPEVIDICNNKILSAKFFKDNAFGVPYTLSDSEIRGGYYKLPLFIKPKDGSSSINAFKINTAKELEFFYDYIDNPIVQECVTGVEYTVDCFIDFDGNIISIVPRKRLATRSGEILKGEIDLNKNIIADVKRLLTVLKPIGHITVQGFYGDDGVFRYIEINPRFGGGAPMSIKAGANSCKWLYTLLSGKNIDMNFEVKDKCIFSRFDDCIMINK